MKYLGLLLAGFTAIIGVRAQAVRFYTGPNIADYDKVSFRLFDQDSLYLYAFRYKEQNYFLDVYEKESLKQSAFIKLPLPSKDSIKYELEDFFIHRDTFQIFYSYFDKTSLYEKLEMIAFNKDGIQIGETKLIDRSEGKNERRAGTFSVINRKKFNEFLSYGYQAKKDTSYINIDHFDYSGNKTRSQNFLLNNNSGYVVHSLLDEDCNLYHLTRNKRGNRNVNWSIRVYSPEADQAQVIELKQPSAEKVYLSNFFKSYLDKQERINLLSPYTSSPSSNNAEGIYLVQIDSKNHTLVKENVIPFKVNSGTSDGESDFSMSSCIIIAATPMSNNITRIVFESRLETTTSFYGIQKREYDIGNIITVDIDSNNVATEIHNIKKQQHTNTSNYKYTGFAILKYGTKSYFIYNELPGNLDRSPDKMRKVNSSKIDETTVIYTVVDNGKVIRKILIDKESRSEIDAILPNTYLSATNKHEIYVVRKIKTEVYLTKIFIDD